MEPLCAYCERWRKEPIIWSSPRLAKERVNLVHFSLHCAQKRKSVLRLLRPNWLKPQPTERDWLPGPRRDRHLRKPQWTVLSQTHSLIMQFQMSGTQCRVAQPGEKSSVPMEKGSQEKPILRMAQMLWFSSRHQSYKGVWQTKEEDTLKQVDNGRPQPTPGERIYRPAKLKHRNTRTENLKPLRLRIQRGMAKKPVEQSKDKEKERCGDGGTLSLRTSEMMAEE